MITEKIITGSPKIIAPKFNCDNALGEIPAPLPCTSFAMCITGNAGSGKTSLLMSLLCARRPNKVYRGVFDHIYFIMPPQSRASLATTLFDDHPPEKVFDELTAENLHNILKKCQESAEADENSLLIIDDCTADLKNKEVEKLLRLMIFNRRHNHQSLIILSQNYNQIPLALRKTFSNFICFKPANKKEMESVFSELVFQPKSVADEIMNYVFKEKRDFLFGDAVNGKLYRNFHLLEIVD